MVFSNLSAAELGREIGAGRADPVEITEAFIEAIEAHPFGTEIYARTTFERARGEAEKASARAKAGKRAGPLDGVPVSWKDLYDTKGIGTESGAALLKGRVPDADAVVLQKATQSGAVCLGKTHQTEFAFSGLGINPNTATPPNKDFPGCVPGGSSSGAAASITHGLAPIAIGSDTGGSVRIPACWNSLVGMKTTHGLLSLENVVPLCPGFDTVGPLTKTVEDAALMIEAMGGGKADLSDLPDASNLRFAVVETLALDDCDAVQMAAFDEAIAALTKAGAKVDTIQSSDFPDSQKLSPILFPYEAWQAWGELIENNPGVTYGPVEERFKYGRLVSVADYENAWADLAKLRLRFFDSVSVYDGILMPTVPVQPPQVDELLADSDKFVSVNILALRNTRFGNLLGTCALTLPTNTKGAGLQIIGKPMADIRLMKMGVAIENLVKG